MIGISPFSSSILLFGQSGGTPVDPDAQAFITAAAITDPTQQSAVNQLVVDLKGYGVWTKMKALYPFVGGTSTAHSYNLKNTAQYQITWYGGVTHDSVGVQFNGTNGYGDTGLTPNGTLSLNSTLIGSKFASNFTGNFAIGTTTGSRIEYYRSFSDTYFAVNSSTESYFSLSDTSGIILMNRNSSTNQALYKNGTLLSNASATSTSLPTTKIFLGCRSTTGNTPSDYSSNKQSLMIISDGVSSPSGLNTILQTYATALGR
jgi:hypothetical protein